MKSALELIPDNPEAKRLHEDYKTRQGQIEEQEARRIATERAAEDRQRKLVQIQAKFEKWCGFVVAGADSITRQEIVTTLPLKGAGEAIEKALKDVPSAFEKVKVDWTEAEMFSIHAEQKLPDAYRHCMVIGGQISASECVVCFKVVDFQPQRAVSVLGGLLTAQLTTQADRDGTRAARFQTQAMVRRFNESWVLVMVSA